MADVTIDPALLAKAADPLGDPVPLLKARFADFQAQQNDPPRPWGDDNIGHEFGAIFEPQLKKLEDGVLHLIEGLAKVQGMLGQTANDYVTTEQNNAS